jgi:hypothetical protein
MDSTDVPMDTLNKGINDAIRSLAKDKQVVLVDYHQAMKDYTKDEVFNEKWWDDSFVHPSSGCDPDLSEPTCGYGIRNAVCWHAVNKVYRIVIDDGPADNEGNTFIASTFRQKRPLSADNVFRVAVIPGTSHIKLLFSPEFQPRSIRLLNVNGKALKPKITFNSREALISINLKVVGVYIIEVATSKGKTYYQRVLLTS